MPALEHFGEVTWLLGMFVGVLSFPVTSTKKYEKFDYVKCVISNECKNDFCKPVLFSKFLHTGSKQADFRLLAAKKDVVVCGVKKSLDNLYVWCARLHISAAIL